MSADSWDWRPENGSVVDHVQVDSADKMVLRDADELRRESLFQDVMGI